MSSTAGTATPVATSFVQALRSNETLYQAYTNEFVSSSDDAPPSSDDVTKFIQSQGYDTNLADVNAALASVSANDLSFWQGDYNTQFIDEGSTGPRVVIQAGVVTVLGTQINNYTFNNFTLAWTDSTNTSNGQITFASMVGLNPQSDPTSPSLQSTQGQDDTSAGIANPYIGPQFQGFFWAQGRHQPSDANIWVGEAVIELLKKGLPLLWRGLKALFRGVNNLIQKFRGSAPEPTDAETELSPSGPVESGEPVEGKPVDPAEGGPEPDLNIEPAGDPVIEPPVIEPPIDPVNIPEVPAEEGLIPEIEGVLVDVIEGGLIAV
ncbi:hypothetical protein CGCF413_v012876 [Colletotrichum fructicola]|nr:hypothetical protein CFRS1_v009950 [Colletotrichum fructicola]KAF5487791.1 hypothetical protein CGCF413_v012876 [Colletotrichum fructicola]